jgi:thiol-disulfide isomerase/thioredoxin
VRASPALKAGVREADRIVKVDGHAVLHAPEVTRLISAHAAGESLVVTVARAGGETDVRVTLEPRPSADEMLRMDHVGAFAPAWTSTVPVGSAPKSMAELRGRVVVLDFWASWCGPCRMMPPRLNALQARFGAQGLTVVGITTDDAETAAAYAARNDMRYGVVVDATADTSRAYGISGLPTMFVVDKRGVVRKVEVGFDPQGDHGLEEIVKTLLAEPAAPSGSSR